MIEVYYTKNEFVHRKAEILIERKLGKGFEIKRNENGKPYVSGNPVYFSISHSAGRAMIALSDKPVGIDLEFYRPRKFEHILKRLSARERKCYLLFSRLGEQGSVRQNERRNACAVFEKA